MSLVGNLEDLPLTDILQILSISKRTGILTLETYEGRSIIVFKTGLIVSAVCSSPRIKTFGQTLIDSDVLTPDRLQEILQLQKLQGNEPLGSLLVSSGILTKEQQEQILVAHIKSTVFYLMHQAKGKFSFDISEVVPFDEVRYNPLELALENGLNPQHLLLDSARINDEWNRMSEQHRPDPFELPDLRAVSSVEYGDRNQNQSSEISSSVYDVLLPETFELPDLPFEEVVRQVEQAYRPDVEPQRMSTRTSASGEQQRTVLLVEDEATIRQMMTNHLRRKGFEVYQADSSSAAIGLCKELIATRPSVWIITDLVMPTSAGNGYLGGLEIVESVRRINTTVPILIMTDFEDVKAQNRAFSLGVHQFQKKPSVDKTTLKNFEASWRQFTDRIIEAFQQPPHRLLKTESGLHPEVSEDKSEDSAASAKLLLSSLEALKELLQTIQEKENLSKLCSFLLDYAAEFFDRAIFFEVDGDFIQGVNGFGNTGDAEIMAEKTRRIRFDIRDQSIFSKTMNKKQPHIGKLADTPTNRKFVSMTGTLLPTQMVMIPLIGNNEVIAMIYGDNAVNKKPIRNVEGLEIFLVQAGIALENAFLHHKIKVLRFT
jgi:CheY-like chemotaxis protein